VTATQLLKLSLNALLQTKHEGPLSSHLEMPAPFDRPYQVADLTEAIVDFLANSNGFTVLLGYPPGTCEKPGETYSSTSSAPTWEEAVLAVAREMWVEDLVSDGDELTICDVFHGCENSTYPGTDRYAVIRFHNDGTPRLLDAMEAQDEDYNPLVSRDEQLSEGWVLMNEDRDADGNPMAEIQRDDDSDTFKTDDQAIAFVRGEAAKGKIYHIRAITLHNLFEADYRANLPAPGEMNNPSKKEP
jgi:hypothetical protein